MRDQTIINMSREAAQRDGLILAQFEFLKTRQEALERVMVTSTLVQRLRYVWRPAELLAAVDAAQRTLLDVARSQMAAAAAKAKIQVVPAVHGL